MKNKLLYVLKKCLPILVVLCFLVPTYGQDPDSSSIQLLKRINVESNYFTTDNLAQFYVVRNNDQLIKYNAQGDSLFQFNNHQNGELAIIDATDPFNLLLYYPDFMKVVTLDRTLSPSSEYNLFELDIVDIPAIGMSNDNNIWIYDNTSFTLKKIDRNGKLVVESENLSFQLKTWLQPNFILERDNFVYVNDPFQGIFIFDLFGKYVKTLDITGLEDFQIQEKNLIYQKETSLISFNMTTLNEVTIPLPLEVEAVDQVYIQRNFLFVKKEESILVYQF